ncbi:MAG TPA: hypothetical protein VHV74_23105 [Pseudonocardiaceae bacterium]|jgi:hypothetical protein|nr:hypothetical protein [Pseudonocardiaceae bacterium]
MPTTLKSRVLISAAALALGATLLASTAALAAPPRWTPNPGDDRATAHAGNVTTCSAAGLPGKTITLPGLEDSSGIHVTITASDLPAGDTILAVVVKGGPGYNVYQGLTAWTDLHSPLNVGHQIPTISHWFACVTTSDTTTTTTTGATTTTTTTGATATTTGPAATTTTTGAGSTTPGNTTTTNAAVAGATTTTPPGTKQLAFTGFDNSWLIWVGALLLIAGAGVVALPRLARRRS